jgi:hypothetical protein
MVGSGEVKFVAYAPFDGKRGRVEPAPVCQGGVDVAEFECGADVVHGHRGRPE